jgi:serine phosphatase RsbU (regulator of sigma subunit)
LQFAISAFDSYQTFIETFMSDSPTEHPLDCSSGQHLRDISALYEISLALTSGFDLETLLQRIADTAVSVLSVKGCSIRLLDEQTGEMVLRAVSGLSQDYVNKGPVVVYKSVFREVFESGKAAQVFDVRNDLRIQYPAAAVEEGIASMLCVGLMHDGKAFGAICAYTERPHVFDEEEIRLFQAIANHSAVAIQIARLHRDLIETQRIEQELAIAGDILRNLIPSESPRPEGFDIAARNIPSYEVGGDFYDFIQLPSQHWGIAVADVVGKGIPAAILMTAARAAMRAEIEDVYRVRDVVGRVNRALCRDTRPHEFVTLFYAALNVPERILTYTNAGHNPPLLLRCDLEMFLDDGGPPLGLFRDVAYREGQVQLEPGDVLLLFTDGVTDRNQNLFGEERLRHILRDHKDASAADLLGHIHDAIRAFTGDAPQSDDLTLVVVKVEEQG